MVTYTQEWGVGDPVIALHPLGLDASAFAGLGTDLAARGFRTVALDLPGFGLSPAPDAPLTPARLAEPVVELARQMADRPALLGYSMGGRVALEAALAEPGCFRAAVLIAPYLPWTRFRWALAGAHLMSPALVARFPLEWAWPLLKTVTRRLEASPRFRDDDIARAAARMIYNASCPATRASIVSAAREMALDPAFGARGLWERLPGLQLPATFLWGHRDLLVPIRYAHRVARALPQARQRILPCLGHALHGEHHRCLAAVVAAALAPAPEAALEASSDLEEVPCRLSSTGASAPRVREA